MGDENDIPFPEHAEEQGDDRLIHALLLHLNDPQATELREQRVQRAMSAIRQSTGRRVLHLPAWARRSVWATAATLLIAVGIFALLYNPKPARASLEQILGALSSAGDRTFHIHVQPPDTDPGSRHTLDDAKLYLRDGKQYLLVRNDLKGGQLYDGYDGQKSWRIRGGVLVEAREGLGAGGVPMPQLLEDVSFADLSKALQRVATEYDLERFDQAPLQAGGDPLQHVLARRKSRLVKGPETIEIWADSKTGMPHRIVFDKAKFQGSTEPRRLTLELISESALSADWFGHQRLGRLGDLDHTRTPD